MSRRATIRTDCDDPELVARSLAPDNTDEMKTTVERTDEGRGSVVTRIDRETTSGLRSTVDDYVVNLSVAIDVATHARNGQHAEPTDAGPASDSDTDSTHDTQ